MTIRGHKRDGCICEATIGLLRTSGDMSSSRDTEANFSQQQWGLVLAGISDFARPAESLSLSQNAALVCTGAIWTRWCFVIKPRNLL